MELIKYVPYREALINHKKTAIERLTMLEKLVDPTITEEKWASISDEMDDCIDQIVHLDALIKTYDSLKSELNI